LTLQQDSIRVWCLGLFFNEALPYRLQGLRFPVGKVVVLLGGLSRLLDRFVQRLGIGRSACMWVKKGMLIFMIFKGCTCWGGDLPMAGLVGIGRGNALRCEWRPCLRMISKKKKKKKKTARCHLIGCHTTHSLKTKSVLGKDHIRASSRGVNELIE
jgi:hypothetical protein